MIARVALVVGVVLAGAAPVAPQDGEVPLLAHLIREAGTTQDVETSSFQLYRLPLGITLQPVEPSGPGVRFTFPITLGTYRLSADTDVGEVVESLRAVSVSPGLEVQVPVGERWLLTPFIELELAASSADDTETLLSAGLRTRAGYRLGSARLTAGGAARWTSPRTRRELLSDYSSLCVGVDAQLPLGMSFGSRQALAGVYGLVRVFPGLEIGASGGDAYAVGDTWELGLSFSTEPVLELWRIPVPWIAVGYRFGDLFEGVRISLSFPF